MNTFNYQNYNNNSNNNYSQYQNKNPLQLFYNPLYNHTQFNNLHQYINTPQILSLLKQKQLSFQFFFFNNHNTSIHLYNNNIYNNISNINQFNNLHTYINSPNIIQLLTQQQLTIYYIIYNPTTHQLYNQFYKIINKSISTYTPNNINNSNNQPNTSHNNFNQLLSTPTPTN